MAVKLYTKQQIFDMMVKFVNDEKAKSTAALSDHKREMQDLHSTAMASGQGHDLAGFARHKPGPAEVLLASSTARSTASLRVLSSAAPISDSSFNLDTPVDDLSPGARRLYDVTVGNSASATPSAHPPAPSRGVRASDFHEPPPATSTATRALEILRAMGTAHSAAPSVLATTSTCVRTEALLDSTPHSASSAIATHELDHSLVMPTNCSTICPGGDTSATATPTLLTSSVSKPSEQAPTSTMVGSQVPTHYPSTAASSSPTCDVCIVPQGAMVLDVAAFAVQNDTASDDTSQQDDQGILTAEVVQCNGIASTHKQVRVQPPWTGSVFETMLRESWLLISLKICPISTEKMQHSVVTEKLKPSLSLEMHLLDFGVMRREAELWPLFQFTCSDGVPLMPWDPGALLYGVCINVQDENIQFLTWDPGLPSYANGTKSNALEHEPMVILIAASGVACLPKDSLLELCSSHLGLETILQCMITLLELQPLPSWVLSWMVALVQWQSHPSWELSVLILTLATTWTWCCLNTLHGLGVIWIQCIIFILPGSWMLVYCQYCHSCTKTLADDVSIYWIPCSILRVIHSEPFLIYSVTEVVLCSLILGVLYLASTSSTLGSAKQLLSANTCSQNWQHNTNLQNPLCWNGWNFLLLLLGWFLVPFLHWFWKLLPAVLRYISYNCNEFLASLNGSAALQHILQVGLPLLPCTERNPWPPPLVNCMTISMVQRDHPCHTGHYESHYLTPCMASTRSICYAAFVNCDSGGVSSGQGKLSWALGIWTLLCFYMFLVDSPVPGEGRLEASTCCCIHYAASFLGQVFFNHVELQFPEMAYLIWLVRQWDPGGSASYRLGVKPELKEGGIVSDLLVTPLMGRDMGWHPWALACQETSSLPLHIPGKGDNDGGLERDGFGLCVCTSPSSSSSSSSVLGYS